LPDGLFSNLKSRFGYILKGLRLVNVYIFYGHLEYCTDIWDILWPFGTFCDHLDNFLVSCTKKIWQPCSYVPYILLVFWKIKFDRKIQRL
jgi:hypothetical protein